MAKAASEVKVASEVTVVLVEKEAMAASVEMVALAAKGASVEMVVWVAKEGMAVTGAKVEAEVVGRS